MNRTRRYLISVVAVLALTVLSLVGVLVLDARPKLGLDLQGGISVVLTATGDIETDTLDQTVEIIRNRVDSLGAQEPEISRSGEDNIIVQLPGIEDRERALAVIGQTAQLRFREVVDALPLATVEEAVIEDGAKRSDDDFREKVNAALEEQDWSVTRDDPVDEEVVFRGKDDQEDVLFRLGPAEVRGDQVGNANANFDQTGAQGWTVELTLNGDGREAWSDVTTRLSAEQKQLAIVLDRRVESAPTVQDPITDGRASISGGFTETEAKDLALVLRTGALPIELEQSQVQSVSATLGDASLRSGLIAGAIGLVLVAIYMFYFYRVLGLITLFGLGLFSALIMGVIGIISVSRGFSLTLAGVAGLIVSVGIAADSYIIYFERVKDELLEGKSFRTAVERAFKSALRTNIAANGVAFLAAIILYLVAVGPVRGFALTLGISVMIDVFLLNFFTHPIVALIARNGRALSMRGAPAKRRSEPEAVTTPV